MFRLALLLALCCALAAPLLPGPAAAQDAPCRHVTVQGSIQIRPNPEAHAQDPGRGLVICTSAGELSMDLLFPPDSGELLAQDNTVTLTDYACHSFGTADPCIAAPHAEAYTPRAFQLHAELDPEGVRYLDADDQLTAVKDAFNFRVSPVPAPDVVMVTMECGGAPGDVPDPTIFTQLLMPFIESYWNHTAVLGQSVDETFTDYPVNEGQLLATIQWTVSEEFAACPQAQ